MSREILLESGTGELEVIEFVVNDNHYAINVVKVREVIPMPKDGLTKLPETKEEIAGVILCRNEILTIVDLKYILANKHKCPLGSKVIVCEFNKIKVAFNIDDVVGVHRIKWTDIVKPDELTDSSLVVGNIVLGDKIISMIDFEKIVTDICPSSGISEDRIVDVDYHDRNNVKLVLADDSALIRRLLKDTLIKAGFNKLTFFDDGQKALDYLLDLQKDKGEDFINEVQLLITDIEMPQMDGLTLTRKIKENNVLKKLPVIVFSSLITDELRHKGEECGADAQLSKPEVEQLVAKVDELISNKL